MGKKLKKIKINKFWKNIFKNRPLMVLVVVLILAGIFSSPKMQQYFKATGSNAAGIDLGGGIGLGGGEIGNSTPVNLIFSPETKIEGLHDVSELADAYGDYVLFCGRHYPHGYFQNDLFLYNVKTKAPAEPITDTVENECSNWNASNQFGKKAAIYGSSIAYISSISRLHTYNISSKVDTEVDIYNENGQSLSTFGLDLFRDQVILSLQLDPFHAPQIWSYRIGDNEAVQLSNALLGRARPAIQQNNYIWTDNQDVFNGNTNIYLGKIGSIMEKQISDSSSGKNDFGDIWGNKIVWNNWTASEGRKIRLYDAVSGTTKTIGSDLKDSQVRPLTVGNRFVLFTNLIFDTASTAIYLYDNKYDKLYNLTGDSTNLVGNNGKIWWQSNNSLYIYYERYNEGVYMQKVSILN
ncbi:MAG: hypothetical protein V1719_01800 [Patescibacteria group bacterium]